MLEIAICDTDTAYREYERDFINLYLQGKSKEYIIKEYTSSAQILQSNYTKTNLFILEVELNGEKSGIDIARSIRNYNQDAAIIFITSNIEEAHNAFEVEATRYLIKPVEATKFYEALDSAAQIINKNDTKCIRLKQGKKLLQLDCDSIIYFETMNRKLKVITTDKAYLIDNSINELTNLLIDKGFFRIHKSYLINLRYVLEYNQGSVTMQNSDVVYMSRLKLKDFRDIFYSYTEQHCIKYKMIT